MTNHVPLRRRYLIRGGQVLHWTEHRDGGLQDGGPHSLCGLTAGQILNAQRKAERRDRLVLMPRVCQNCVRSLRKEMLPALRASREAQEQAVAAQAA